MRKGSKDKEASIDFHAQFQNRKMPIAILDEKWLKLFHDSEMPVSIRELRDTLNQLLIRQGAVIDEIKGLKRYKGQLMDEIVSNMDVNNSAVGRLKAKMLDKNQKLIMDSNSRLEALQDELADIPYQIKEANEQIMEMSVQNCYEQLRDSNEEIRLLEEQILALRLELQDRILKKEDKVQKITTLYSYMHDTLGAEKMEILDKSLDWNDYISE